MIKRNPARAALLAALCLALAACSGRGESAAEDLPPAATNIPPAAVETPADQPGEAPPQETQAPSQVLQACDPAMQARAMRPDQLPDWEALNPAACYRLELSLEPAEARYSGRAEVTLTNPTSAPLADLVFRTYPNAPVIYGGELQVTEARVDGEPVEAQAFLPDRTAVRLPLPAALAPGDSVVAELEFEGRFTVDFGDLSRVYGVFNYATEESVLTLANAYPVLAELEGGEWQAAQVTGIGDAVVSQAALYEVEISAPEDWQVAASGTQVDEQVRDKQATRRFVTGPVREFMLIASPAITLEEAEVDGTTVRHWGLPGGEGRWAESLQVAVDSLALFNQRFGPYPYAELDSVAVPLRNASGVEYPGLIIIGAGLYEPDEERPFLLGIVVSHEVAHQWWYGLVGSDVLEHPWQDEALAVLGSLVYQQEYQPRFYAGTLAFYRSEVELLGEETVNTGLGQSLEDFKANPGLYGPVVYEQGGVFFEELRKKVGEGDFFAALQAYYAQQQYRLAAPEDLLQAFEQACRCELDDFYAQWGVD